MFAAEEFGPDPQRLKTHAQGVIPSALSIQLVGQRLLATREEVIERPERRLRSAERHDAELAGDPPQRALRGEQLVLGIAG